MGRPPQTLALVLFLALAPAGAQAPPTPPGGTVRALAADPAHPGTVLLGTTTGVVFRSPDAGRHWSFFSRVAPHDDWVVSALVADPSHSGRWYAALWSWGSPGGGVYASDDDGRSWQPRLTGHAVRALAIAASDPARLVAASLDGVYASRDHGQSWSLISPAHDRELSNIESVAIDPENADHIYVGTWHLPWRTLNGGHDWWQMRDGVIDDSDVFSIAIDRAHPATVYLSACSGIYRSDDHGNLFRKIQGIPYSARRTPALVPDPDNPATVYAGTTQGLWLSRDSGATWRRITAPNLRVNTVLSVHHRILLGTDFAGVYASPDPGLNFAAANRGFSSRQVSAVAASPAGEYLAVTGDQAWGGVFFRATDGDGWQQLPALPGDADVSGLHWSPRGLVAATRHGVYVWQAASGWQQPRTAPEAAVYALASPATGSPTVFAASQSGLYRSPDGGLSWSAQHAAPSPLYRLLALPATAPPDSARWLWVAGDGYVLRSNDQGRHFLPGRLGLDSLPGPVARINQLAAAPDGDGPPLLLAATTRGLYLSRDYGAHWSLCGHGLPALDVRFLHVQPDGLYAGAAQVGQTFRSTDGGVHWQAVQLPAALEAWARSAPQLTTPWSAAATVDTERGGKAASASFRNPQPPI